MPRRHRRGHPGVVRLHATRGDEGVGAIGERARANQLEFANLVAAEPERDRIITLDEQARATAQDGPKAGQFLDRRGIVPERERGHGRQSG